MRSSNTRRQKAATSNTTSPAIQEALRFRTPMQVSQIRCFYSFDLLAGELLGYPVCPQCGITMERTYQAYCDRCGQCLNWNNLKSATIILPAPRKSVE